jgi:hypothetical protein
MSDDREPPADVVTTFAPAPQLTRAVTRKGEIRFELRVPENSSARDMAKPLRAHFRGSMPRGPAGEVSTSVEVDDRDPSKFTVIYKPHARTRDDLERDIKRMFMIFGDMSDGDVIPGIRDAFNALEKLNGQEQGTAVAAEIARRSGGKEPGSRKR